MPPSPTAPNLRVCVRWWRRAQEWQRLLRVRLEVVIVVWLEWKVEKKCDENRTESKNKVKIN